MFAIDNKRLWLPIAGVAAVLAGVIVWLFLHHLEWAYQEAGEMVPVLVASHYMPRGSPLDPALFQVTRIPKAFVEPGALSNFNVLESSPGHPHFRSLLPVPEGTQLVQRELVPISQLEALSQEIPENQVAISFGVDHVHGLGGNIQPGDLIDILHIAKGKEMSPEPRETSSLFQAVPVIAVGKKWAAPSRSNVESEKTRDERSNTDEEEITILTVLLNPLAAIRLADARENEVLSVMLRAPGDTRVLENLPQ